MFPFKGGRKGDFNFQSFRAFFIQFHLTGNFTVFLPTVLALTLVKGEGATPLRGFPL